MELPLPVAVWDMFEALRSVEVVQVVDMLANAMAARTSRINTPGGRMMSNVLVCVQICVRMCVGGVVKLDGGVGKVLWMRLIV